MPDLSPVFLARCCYRLGRLLSTLGWHGGALQSYRDALRFDSAFAFAHFGQGEECVRLGRWREAAACFEKAAALRPSDIEIQGNRVFALFRAGLYDDTAVAIERLARLRPDQQELHLLLGAVLRRADRHAEALRAFRWAVRLPPRTEDRRFHLGLALLGEQEWAEVMESCRAARAFEGARPSTLDLPAGRSALQAHPGASAGEYYRLTSRSARPAGWRGLGALLARWLPRRERGATVPFPAPGHPVASPPRATMRAPSAVRRR